MSFTKPTRQRIRIVVVTGVGGGILVLGMICLVLPLPGTPLVIVGLVILGTEYAWSKRLLQKIPQWLNRLRGFKPHARTAASLWIKGLIAKAHKAVAKF